MEKCSICIKKRGWSLKSRVMVDSSAEESGWSLYFEDLLNNKGEYFDEERKCSVFDDEIGSLVSDAASSASASLKTTSWKSLSFKRRRGCVVTKRSSIAADDDSLEDTASSPVNSPKVSTLYQKETINRKQKEYTEIVQENGSELKKRGLCLVPVSTIVNYLG